MTQKLLPLFGLAPLGLFALTAVPAAAQDLQISRTSSAYQREASVAVSPAGQGMIVWAEGPEVLANDYDLYGRRFDSAGNLLGAEEFLISTYTTGRQFDPQAAAFSNGDFIVTWSGVGGLTNEDSIWARRFDSQGDGIGSEFQVNNQTSVTLGYPDVSVAPDQSFLIVWGAVTPTDSSTLFGRRFDSMGQPLGAELALVDESANSYRGVRLVHSEGGEFFAVWEQNRHIFARLFSSAGAPISDLHRLNGDVVVANSQPGAAFSDGVYLATYNRTSAQLFDSSGTPIGTEIKLGNDNLGSLPVTSAVGVPGGFLIVWAEFDGAGAGIFRRWIATDGGEKSALRRVNVSKTQIQVRPDIGVDAQARINISWELDRSAAGRDIYGLLQSPAFSNDILIDDFESGDTSLWDEQIP